MLLSGFKRSKKLGCASLVVVVVAAGLRLSSCIGHPAGGAGPDDDDEATGGCRSGNDELLMLAVDAVLPIVT